jgi:hypothetical protein
VDPHSLVGQVSGNKESEQNDGSSGSYESPSGPCPSIKRKQSSGLQDDDYVPEEQVYDH